MIFRIAKKSFPLLNRQSKLWFAHERSKRQIIDESKMDFINSLKGQTESTMSMSQKIPKWHQINNHFHNCLSQLQEIDDVQELKQTLQVYEQISKFRTFRRQSKERQDQFMMLLEKILSLDDHLFKEEFEKPLLSIIQNEFFSQQQMKIVAQFAWKYNKFQNNINYYFELYRCKLNLQEFISPQFNYNYTNIQSKEDLKFLIIASSIKNTKTKCDQFKKKFIHSIKSNIEQTSFRLIHFGDSKMLEELYNQYKYLFGNLQKELINKLSKMQVYYTMSLVAFKSNKMLAFYKKISKIQNFSVFFRQIVSIMMKHPQRWKDCYSFLNYFLFICIKKIYLEEAILILKYLSSPDDFKELNTFEAKSKINILNKYLQFWFEKIRKPQDKQQIINNVFLIFQKHSSIILKEFQTIYLISFIEKAPDFCTTRQNFLKLLNFFQKINYFEKIVLEKIKTFDQDGKMEKNLNLQLLLENNQEQKLRILKNFVLNSSSFIQVIQSKFIDCEDFFEKSTIVSIIQQLNEEEVEKAFFHFNGGQKNELNMFVLDELIKRYASLVRQCALANRNLDLFWPIFKVQYYCLKEACSRQKLESEIAQYLNNGFYMLPFKTFCFIIKSQVIIAKLSKQYINGLLDYFERNFPSIPTIKMKSDLCEIILNIARHHPISIEKMIDKLKIWVSLLSDNTPDLLELLFLNEQNFQKYQYILKIILENIQQKCYEVQISLLMYFKIKYPTSFYHSLEDYRTFKNPNTVQTNLSALIDKLNEESKISFKTMKYISLVLFDLNGKYLISIKEKRNPHIQKRMRHFYQTLFNIQLTQDNSKVICFQKQQSSYQTLIQYYPELKDLLSFEDYVRIFQESFDID